MASATTTWRHQVAFSWDRSWGNEETFEDDFVTGSGHDKFFTVDPERSVSLPFQRYSLDHHRQSAGGEGFGKVIFRRKVPLYEQTRSQEIKRSVSSMPSSLPAVLEMCRHKFVDLLFFFTGWQFCFSFVVVFYPVKHFCFQIVDVPHPLRCRHLQGQRGGSEKAAQRIQVLQRCRSMSLINNQWLLIQGDQKRLWRVIFLWRT